MARSSAWTAISCGLMAVLVGLPGCVTAYDPSGPPRLGLGKRGPGMAAPRVDHPGAPTAAPQALVISTGAEAPLWAEVDAGAAPTRELPRTAAGEQLRWVISAMSGQENLRRIAWRFSPAFLEQVPLEQFRTIVTQWQRDELDGGEAQVFRALRTDSPAAAAAILKSSVSDRYSHIRLSVDDQGRIAGLFLAPAPDLDTGLIASFDRLDQRLGALAGQATLAIYEFSAAGNLQPVHAFNPQARLAVGSTAKLFVLGALAEMIAAGQASWDQPLEVRDDLKSMGAGQVQVELEGQEFSIERFAELMIARDDHSAADHLLHFVGRERVEEFAAKVAGGRPDGRPDERNVPFLSTMDVFRLKLSPDPQLPQAYAAANDQRQRAMLEPGGEVATTIPVFAGVMQWRSPRHLETIGWYASAADLARLWGELTRLEGEAGMEPLARILRLNTGMAFDARVWPEVSHMGSGAGEPGISSMTWRLRRADGRRYVVVAILNNAAEEVERRRFSELAGAGIGLVAGGSR